MYIQQFGHEKLSCWFELSYASFLTVPRVLMEAMPNEWQGKIAQLLEEMDNTFPNLPDIGYRVQATKKGRLTKFPKWFLNYRHPDYKEIENAKKEKDYDHK